MKTSLPLSKETHRKIQAFKQKKADARTKAAQDKTVAPFNAELAKLGFWSAEESNWAQTLAPTP